MIQQSAGSAMIVPANPAGLSNASGGPAARASGTSSSVWKGLSSGRDLGREQVQVDRHDVDSELVRQPGFRDFHEAVERRKEALLPALRAAVQDHRHNEEQARTRPRIRARWKRPMSGSEQCPKTFRTIRRFHCHWISRIGRKGEPPCVLPFQSRSMCLALSGPTEGSSPATWRRLPKSMPAARPQAARRHASTMRGSANSNFMLASTFLRCIGLAGKSLPPCFCRAFIFRSLFRCCVAAAGPGPRGR